MEDVYVMSSLTKNSKSQEKFDKFDLSNIKENLIIKRHYKNMEREAKNWETIFSALVTKKKFVVIQNILKPYPNHKKT